MDSANERCGGAEPRPMALAPTGVRCRRQGRAGVVTPSISVALCTRNGARFIEEQVRSILRQSQLPLEIVLSDDASSDTTVQQVQDLVHGFVAADATAIPTLRVLLNSSPLGVVKNFEQATLACSGDLIALCDQDDRWSPERLATMARAFSDDPTLLLQHSNARLVDDSGSPFGYTLFDALDVTTAEKREVFSGDGFHALLRRNLVTGATTVFRRELLERTCPFPEAWIHDEWLAIVAAASGRINLIDEPLIDYRQHGGNEIGARKLTLHQAISKFREPRDERNEHLVSRAEVLVSRLDALGALVPSANVHDARAKLAHDRARLALPRNRLRRIFPVLRAAFAGRYARYSRGGLDVVRDLLQPVRLVRT